MISLTNIEAAYGDRIVIDGVSLDVKQGEVAALVGPSGAGKSTLLRCTNLLEKPRRGTITVGDVTVDAASASHADVLRLRRATAMVFQSFNLFSRKTALENVAEGLLVVRGLDKREAIREAAEQLDRVGLTDHSHQYPSQLSGGQQQRVGIARALAMRPEVLLLDEPTSALDPELVGEVLATIRRVASEGQTMILVSHEMHFVRQVANRVVFLEGGAIREDLPPEQFFGAEANERTRAFLHDYHLAHGNTDYQI